MTTHVDRLMNHLSTTICTDVRAEHRLAAARLHRRLCGAYSTWLPTPKDHYNQARLDNDVCDIITIIYAETGEPVIMEQIAEALGIKKHAAGICVGRLQADGRVRSWRLHTRASPLVVVPMEADA